MGGCLTVCSRARQTARGTSPVNSFLISRGLAKRVFMQKRPILLEGNTFSDNEGPHGSSRASPRR